MGAEEKGDRTALFEEVAVPRAVMTLSVPTMIASLVMMIYSLADTLFVGMLNDSVQTAAVTLAFPIISSLNALNNLCGIGGSSLMSRALGKGERDTAKRAASFSLWCAIGLGLLYSLAAGLFMTPLLSLLGANEETASATRGYLLWTIVCGAAPAVLNVVMAHLVRAEGYSLHASVGTMSGCLLNIVLDPFFILPQFLGLGAAGAGLATFLSNCVACVYFLVLLFSKRRTTAVSLDVRLLAHAGKVAPEIFKVGIPAALQNLFTVVCTLVLDNLTAAYGTDAVAAMGIAVKVSHVPMYIAQGMAQGGQPLIGYCYGKGDTKRMKSSFFFAMGVSLAVMVLIAALGYVFAAQAIAIFMEDETVVAYGTKLLRGYLLAAPLFAVDLGAVCLYQACGKGLLSLLCAVARKLVLELPLMFLMDALFPLYGLPYAQVIAEAVMSVSACIILPKLLKKIEREHAEAKEKEKEKEDDAPKEGQGNAAQNG